ncbi:MAG: DNA polymerase domain-containing protein [Opitutales bacterium]
MASSPPSESLQPICGLHVDAAGTVHLCLDDGQGERVTETADLRPFAWMAAERLPEDRSDFDSVELEGEGPFNRRLDFAALEAWRDFVKAHGRGDAIETIRQLEHQYLLQQRQRHFGDLNFGQLRRCQFDIEVASLSGNFPNAREKEDRVLAIGLDFGHGPELLELEDFTDKAERALLKRFNQRLQEADPDVLEGHNCFSFDLDYLYLRCKRFRLEPDWGRFGQKVSRRNSRLRVAERWLDYTRFDIPGRTVFDSFLMIQVFDVSTRDLTSYRLKDVAVYLGITSADAAQEERTYVDASRMKEIFDEDRDTFRRYLEGDLRETRGIADILLPTYVAQVKNVPMLLQEACLRGTAAKVDLMLLEQYYPANRALPTPTEVGAFEGGYTRSFETGVFKNVLHFDVASLYPSLLLTMDRNPVGDSLAVFVPTLRQLREYRLRYKQLAREADSDELRREYNARQTSFKILINSFYGYLGFSGARFGDGDLAAEVTRQGRQLLQGLIEAFQQMGCTVLEADTDGIYLSAPPEQPDPEALLAQANATLPEGIELEFDGAFEAMFCYKAKNYALYDGQKVTIRGSALRSRGMEPFLKELTDALIAHQLGASGTDPVELLTELRARLADQSCPVDRLAKREYLSQSPAAYAKAVEGSKKPRRASLEVALMLEPQPRMGEQVAYFITPGEKARDPDWKRARPLEKFDPESMPYDPAYYLRKLDDWEKRYGEFLPGSTATTQAELL